MSIAPTQHGQIIEIIRNLFAIDGWVLALAGGPEDDAHVHAVQRVDEAVHVRKPEINMSQQNIFQNIRTFAGLG